MFKKDNQKKPEVIDSSLTAITESREWFRSQYKKQTLTILSLMGLAVLLVILNVLQFLFQPTPKYFAQSADGRITQLVGLNEPYVEQQGVTDWTLSVIMKTLSLGFTDYKIKLTEVQPNFYEKSFSDFIKSMKSEGIIDLISEKRLNMNPSPKSSPIISSKGLNEEGVYTWHVEFPLTVSYESSQGVFLNQSILATVVVERVSPIKNPKGIMIRQLILKPGK